MFYDIYQSISKESEFISSVHPVAELQISRAVVLLCTFPHTGTGCKGSVLRAWGRKEAHGSSCPGLPDTNAFAHLHCSWSTQIFLVIVLVWKPL